MPTPPDAIPRLRTTPGVCVCGYDLAGLPPGAATKCPECGVVVRGLTTVSANGPRLRWVALASLIPVVLGASAIVVGKIWPPVTAGYPVASLLLLFAITTQVLVAVPVWMIYVYRRFDGVPVLVHFLLFLAAIPACVLVNGLAIFVFWRLMR